METIIYCADNIVKYEDKFVIIERQNYPSGLAFPGGKHEKGETLSRSAVRELKEETGLDLTITEVLGTYSEEGRDPRGRYVSTVFIGTASGEIKNESGKTKVLLLTKEEILNLQNDFVFDHFSIFKDYLEVFGE